MSTKGRERSIRWRYRPAVLPLIAFGVFACLIVMYSNTYLRGIFTFASLLALAYCTPLSQLFPRYSTAAHAEVAFTTLQQWYNQSTGLWIPSTGWWNSANCVTVIADLAAVDENVKGKATSVFVNTYINAQKYNLRMAKVQGVQSAQSDAQWACFLPRSYYQDHASFFPQYFAPMPPAQVTSGFLNDYYDDEGWWALAWIAAYDVTGDTQYLLQAQSIFDDMHTVFGKTNCSTINGVNGGIWWDKSHSYVNAIANELFLDVAAHLANRVPGRKATYVNIAKQQWAWFEASGMMNAQHTINDGLGKTTCKNNAGTVWSYNQGVILGGLTELSKATGDNSYINTATQIADAAIAALAPSGILTDPCEPNCGADGSQFKGVFMRNLQILQQAKPQTRFASFLYKNAASVWQNDRNDCDELSVEWAGPFITPANASTQSSAMDAIVAALATSQGQWGYRQMS